MQKELSEKQGNSFMNKFSVRKLMFQRVFQTIGTVLH